MQRGKNSPLPVFINLRGINCRSERKKEVHLVYLQFESNVYRRGSEILISLKKIPGSMGIDSRRSRSRWETREPFPQPYLGHEARCKHRDACRGFWSGSRAESRCRQVSWCRRWRRRGGCINHKLRWFCWDSYIKGRFTGRRGTLREDRWFLLCHQKCQNRRIYHRRQHRCGGGGGMNEHLMSDEDQHI